MNFYGIEFLENQSNLNDYVKYFLIFGSLVLLILVFSLYLRHRINTKYRDLSIIFSLTLLFALGVQYSDYQMNQTKHSQSSQMVNFIKELAKQENQNSNEIYVNATQFSDGIIVKMNNKFYKVGLNADQNSYTLTETYLINDNIVYTK
ncbi:TPA: DUF3290 domain-containing protein [Enterococcus faecalis]|uniref:DUF3290 domain-containing protein n=1 Tax=Enterococcus TaxID=1350 RepID=UPI0005353904|nr:DUF3290 domain-containing protein [Enterococcus faecalis]EGO7756787.1 DUF3290 domain-containing protein [Enterococcus faecalis]EHG5974525.1 DUF3290 domain-containing protein [Enterococcus faecalis]EIB6519560.1 DUF3290 domain-containing protein [Enterococcus faecalis]EKE4879605.1 DUF3290 domain-containing protein [Enterococcus faecalis]EMC0702284.1 DUF3290 domain-containing protein [Enterococcus faecalis]